MSIILACEPAQNNAPLKSREKGVLHSFSETQCSFSLILLLHRGPSYVGKRYQPGPRGSFPFYFTSASYDTQPTRCVFRDAGAMTCETHPRSSAIGEGSSGSSLLSHPSAESFLSPAPGLSEEDRAELSSAHQPNRIITVLYRHYHKSGSSGRFPSEGFRNVCCCI